jgi:hypothetical protein
MQISDRARLGLVRTSIADEDYYRQRREDEEAEQDAAWNAEERPS